jgi:hypothetical protein
MGGTIATGSGNERDTNLAGLDFGWGIREYNWNGGDIVRLDRQGWDRIEGGNKARYNVSSKEEIRN